MQDLPYWLKALSALSTPAIAILGLGIAWAQWATSRSKLVLDLHNQRAQAYAKFEEPIREVLQAGSCDLRIYLSYCRAERDAMFLFGRDVTDYIRRTRETLNQLSYATTMLAGNLKGEQRNDLLKLSTDCTLKVSEFWKELDILMIPYMRMDQKLPWTVRK